MVEFKLPQFDGSTKWEPYLKQAEILFEMYGCKGDTFRAYRVVEALCGKALNFFGTLSEGIARDFQGLCKAMGSRFGNSKPQLEMRVELYQVCQSEEESVIEYAERVQGMAKGGFATMGKEVVEELSVEFFLRGLNNKSVAFKVLGRGPCTLEEAVGMVKKYNANAVFLGIDLRKRSIEEVHQVVEVPHVLRVKGLKGMVRREGVRGGVTCYVCHKTGHVAAYCSRGGYNDLTVQWAGNGVNSQKGLNA